LSPLISDGPIVALILLVLQSASAGLLRAISFFGGGFVLYLAWGLWRQIRSGKVGLEADAVQNGAVLSTPGALRQAVVINALGPGAWMFWSLSMGPLVTETWRVSPPTAIGFVVAFYATFLLTMAVQVIITHQARRLGEGTVRIALWIGMIVMIGLALQLFYNAIIG
ncbi:MAG: hypothetical protein JW910_14090, partial [Anaerolineae bacterium]|nr:hypothetical protein [Anaerolineae bacterium]